VDLRDNMNFLGTVWGARVKASASFSVATGNQTIDNSFDIEDWDSDNLHNQNTFLWRLSINTSGKYFIGATHVWQGVGGAGNQKRCHLFSTRAGVDTQIAIVQERGMEQNVLTMEAIYDCLAGDYLHLEAFQDTAGALNLVPTTAHIFFAYRISN
jgi:hypothetical protein